MKAAALAAANRRFSKIDRSSIGAAARFSTTTNSGRRITRDDEAADRQRVVPARDPAARDAEHEAGETGDVEPRAEQVEIGDLLAALGLVEHGPRPERPGEPERDVEPEHPLPRDLDERAAEHRADDEADRGDHRVRAHREAELVARERVGHEGGRIGEDRGAADALQDPPEDQLRAVGREAGAERGGREDREADDVGLLAAEEVRQPPGREDEHGRGDHVGEDHPDELQQRRVEAALEVGQRDDQRARVDGRQQHAEAGDGQRPPLVVLVVGGDADAAPRGQGLLLKRHLTSTLACRRDRRSAPASRTLRVGAGSGATLGW